MSNAKIEHRISVLPWCHGLFVLTLFITGCVILTLNILALWVRIRNCPVINTSFLAFWFNLALCVTQLVVSFVISIDLIVLSCKRRGSAQARHIRHFSSHLIGAVGKTGQFITFHPDRHPVISPTNADSQKVKVRFRDDYEDDDDDHSSDENSRRITCCGRCTDCSDDSSCRSNCGWLQPISVMLVLILTGHIASLIWFCQLRGQIQNPDSLFKSQVMNLFVEAKISYFSQTESPSTTDPSLESIDRIPLYPDSEECWLDIQTELHCCGCEEPTDWIPIETTYTLNTQYMEKLPQSCFCPWELIGNAACAKLDVNKTSRGYLYKRGCLNPLITKLDVLFRLQIFAISICLLIMLIGFLSDVIYTFRTAQLVLKSHSDQSQ